MILFFGTRPGKTKTEVLHKVSCPYCQKLGAMKAHTTPNYFHLFWIPIFKISTSNIAECSHCRKTYFQNEFAEEMKRALTNK